MNCEVVLGKWIFPVPVPVVPESTGTGQYRKSKNLTGTVPLPVVPKSTGPVLTVVPNRA